LAPNNYEQNRIYNFLSNLIEKENIIYIPSDELIKAEYISKSKEIIAEEIDAILKVVDAKRKIILTSPTSFYRYYPDKESILNSIIKLRVNDEINQQKLMSNLASMGYLRVNKIDQSLQFAKRGEVIDLFSINYKNPIRIEFFDDIIESIKFFSIETQMSIESLEEISILPASLLIIDENEKEMGKHMVFDKFAKEKTRNSSLDYGVLKGEIDELIGEINRGYLSYKNYKYFKLVKENVANLIDFINNYSLIIPFENEVYNNKEDLINESKSFINDLVKNSKSLSSLDLYNFTINEKGIGNRRFFLSNLKIHNNSLDIDISKPELKAKNSNETLRVIKGYLSLGYQIYAFVNDNYLNTKLKKDLDVLNIEFVENEKEMGNHSVFIENREKLTSGIQFREKRIVFLTAVELFGIKKGNTIYNSRFKAGVILNSYEELNSGDYVVHESRGIGKFLEITTLLVDGKQNDYLKLQYANNNILYVPLYQFNLIRKYVGKEGNEPKLSTLGTDTWERTKRKVKEKINELTTRLLFLYQERESIKGFSFEKDEELQNEFEGKFEYELTQDQQIVLKEIKDEMCSSRVMDRLLCGDVGFGKTEVAFRATFKAILSGKSVVFLCPTTVLAKQHYETALSRFEGFGVRIVLLSRLNNQKTNNENIKLINNGKVDLVIGTHKALSNKINFQNLGLLIIDEEQRFGVEQKEIIKEKYKNIDVLSLSATPIPRTLQSTLIGLKNVSVIKTPPHERLAIQSYVVHYDDLLARDLIKKELARNGQIYFVYNYIDSIYLMAEQLNAIIPDCRIGVIHGRMDKDEIDDVMTKFYQGEIDLLLSTSIIENGLDVRNANLMLIYDADHFGLAQLYQIKGRVGRGDRLAYCYMFIKKGKVLTNESSKRLKAIQDFTELGSGFKISQRDLIIRGAGDILGPQQAGFIDEVGVDMYLRLLNESIAERKNEKKKIQINTFNLLGVESYIPKDFASDQNKIEIYQRVLDCNDVESIDKLKEEIRDMYGKLPESLESLFIKRTIDIYLSTKEVFAKVSEFGSFIQLDTTEEFSNIQSVGTSLFTSLLSYLDNVKLIYDKKVIKINIYKKDNWLSIFKKVCEIILKLYNINVIKEEVYEN